VAVAGLGLIGGSLARDLAAAGVAVFGVDRPAALRRARRAGLLWGSGTLAQATSVADVIVLAAPPEANLALLRALARLDARRLVITDVSSVKGPIASEARRLRLSRFVGGHPMAGSERSGFAASRAGLFQGRPWILIPAKDAAAERAVRRLVRSVGARPHPMSAAAHDRALAFLSHVPQLLAWALADAARSDPVVRRNLRAAGRAFADMTRLAASPEGLWREILAHNRAEVRRAAAAVAAALSRRLPSGLSSRSGAFSRRNP
jgi:prephenate dehydrogenase